MNDIFENLKGKEIFPLRPKRKLLLLKLQVDLKIRITDGFQLKYLLSDVLC